MVDPELSIITEINFTNLFQLLRKLEKEALCENRFLQLDKSRKVSSLLEQSEIKLQERHCEYEYTKLSRPAPPSKFTTSSFKRTYQELLLGGVRLGIQVFEKKIWEQNLN